MGKPRRKPREHDENEKHGYDGKRPELVAVEGLSERERQAKVPPKRNANHCTICRLFHRKHLDAIQHKAAEKLQDDHFAAGLNSMAGGLAAMVAHGNGGNSVEHAMAVKCAAGKHLEQALSAGAVSQRFMLEKIVLEDWSFKQVAVIMRCQDSAVLPALKMALDNLAKHYGMVTGYHEKRLHPFGTDGNNKMLHPFHNRDTKSG